MADINGYKLKGELRTTNSGFSRWGFAEKNGKDVFIKELIDPVYPVHEELLSAEAVRRKKEICRAFEDRWRTIFEMVNECSDGNLVHIEDFFRYDISTHFPGACTFGPEARQHPVPPPSFRKDHGQGDRL